MRRVSQELHCKTMKYLALAVLLTSTVSGSEPWLRLDQAAVQVWTDAGETKAKQSLRFLVEIRELLNAVQPGAPLSSRTVRLILFRSKAEFDQFRPLDATHAAGYYMNGAQYDYIVLRSEVVPGLRSVVFHEYLHLFLRHQNLPIPHWFDEGMSELFSNAEFTRSQIKVGAPISEHVTTLLAQPKTDLRTLFTPGNDRVFYAQSWALVRMLVLDDRYRATVSRFLALLAQGASHAGAFQEAFGKSMEQVSADLRQSLATRPIVPWTFEAALPVLKEGAQPRVVTGEIVLADLLENLQRFEEARLILEKLPRTGEIEAKLGDIARRFGKTQEAFQHYTQAIHFGTQDARVYFERAMIRRDQEEARQQVIDDLREAVSLQPDYAEAFQQLNALTLRDQPPPPHKTGAGWKNRIGDRTVSGRLVKLDCTTSPARFLLDTPNGELTLLVSDPSQVLIGNDPGVGAELACGPMPPRAVQVEYIDASKEITTIQFQ